MRPISLASRFLATLVVSAVLPLLLYGWFSLRAMRDQIDEQVVRVFLPQLAADHAHKIESHLDRVDQSCAVVREIARRALGSGTPAELRTFGRQIELVPDLLSNDLDLLLLADADGRVVTWLDGQMLDPDAHGRRAQLIPKSVVGEVWFQHARGERGSVHVPWGRSPLLFRGLGYRSMDPGRYHLGTALDVPRPNGSPGVLFGLVRWARIQQILDEAREVLAGNAKLPSAQVFLVGSDGVVQAHTDRANYGMPLHPQALAAELVAAEGLGRTRVVDEAGVAWRIGYAPSRREPARAFVLGVAVPETELFAESDRFERVLLMAISVTMFVLVLWSLIASRAIAAPVRALVAATRRIAGGDLQVSVPARGGRELGELAHSFNQMTDELRVGRERLAAAERDQAWAEMARQVAHEIKNPLQPMQLAAQLLQRARSEGDPRADAIAERLSRTVLEQTQELSRIASDFRAFGGIAPQALAVTGLDDWLGELRARCAGLFTGKAIELVVQPGAPAARVAIDANALARVFVNLLQNAIEAAPGGVRVAIASRPVEGGVEVAVTDDGPGVPESVRARLFDPYFTTKSSGTGLGLAICRRLVEAHHGTIRLVRSGPGHTEFAVRLPLA